MLRMQNTCCTFAFMLTATLALPCTVSAQDDDETAAVSTPLAISLGTVRTELEQIALRVAIRYAKAFSGADVLLASSNAALYFTPEFNLEGGDEDAFSSVIAKLAGSLLLFSVTEVDEVRTPNTAFFHTVPFSVGIETSNRFDNINLLGEVGYVPWFQGSVPPMLKTLRLGVFIQGGYKADVQDVPLDPDANRGGNADESSEEPAAGLLRFKGRGAFSPKVTIDRKTGMGLGADLAGDIWYDVLNSEIYFAVKATLRILISDDRSFDFSYQKGSGAPNFNEGDQFSASLTIVF
jgi:hypothetical protein